jgi:hypothetical protein
MQAPDEQKGDAKAPPTSWMDSLRLGEMSLWVAWPIALAFVTGVSLLLVFRFGESIGTKGFIALRVVPAILMPYFARKKNRSAVRWALTGVAMIPLGITQPVLQPWTLLVVLWLVEPLRTPAPEEIDEREQQRRRDDMISEMRRVADRLSGLSADVEAHPHPDQTPAWSDTVRSIRHDVIALPTSKEELLTRARALMAASVNRYSEAERRGIVLAEFLRKHPETQLPGDSKAHRKALKDGAAFTTEANLGTGYLDEARARVSALEASRRDASSTGEGSSISEESLSSEAPSSTDETPSIDDGSSSRGASPGPPHSERARPARGRRRPRY